MYTQLCTLLYLVMLTFLATASRSVMNRSCVLVLVGAPFLASTLAFRPTTLPLLQPLPPRAHRCPPPSIAKSVPVLRGCTTSRRTTRDLLLASSSSHNNEPNRTTSTGVARRFFKNGPLERSHEKIIFLVTLLAQAALYWGWPLTTTSSTTLQQWTEVWIAWTWSSMVLAISFLEAWVKFRAPFLRKHVAVDVGRHVFAALNAVELAFCSFFWSGRIVPCIKAGVLCRHGAAYYCQPMFVGPAAATAILLVQVWWIAPKLFLRAKSRIVDGLKDESSNLSEMEQAEWRDLSKEVAASTLPSPKWHRAYALLELAKVVCLQGFARWMVVLLI